MKLVLRAAVGVFALSAAMPAASSIIYDYDTGILTVDGNTTIGESVTISFNGHHAFNGPAIPGLTADLTFAFQGLNGNNYVFDYIITNTSGPPITSAWVTIFGFADVITQLSAASSVTGIYTNIGATEFPGNRFFEFCVKEGAGAHCFGSEGGPGVGESGSGTLTLGFESLNAQIMMSGLAIRWQYIGSQTGYVEDTYVIGTPMRAGIPEPASWATMLLGLAAVGLVLRRRRKSPTPQAT